MKNEDKRMFPLFIDMRQKNILIAGGGNIACRRIKTLTDFVSHLTVVSPVLTPETEKIIQENGYRWIAEKYRKSQLEGIDLALACTSDPGVNRQIGLDCRERGIFVNVASEKDLCDFHFPGILLEEEVTIAFNASGKNHEKVKDLREEIKTYLNFRKEKKGEEA